MDIKDKNILMKVTAAAKKLVAEEGYDPIYGARPLKIYIENVLETSIAKKIIKGDINDGSIIGVDAKDDQIVIEKI